MLAAPAVPEGLAARIVAQATRLPQDAPTAPVEQRPAMRPVVRAPVQVVPLRTPLLARMQRRWVGAGAGFAALAAGLAVFALVGAPRQDDPMAHAADAGQDAAAALAAMPAASLAGEAAPGPASTVAPAGQLAASARALPHAATRTQGAASAAPASAPETPLTPEPDALAVALPPSVAEGPVAAPDADDAAPVPGARGQMGPAVPQGFGYTGGAPGSIPSNAPVTMSGGPGMGGPRGGPGPHR